MSVILYKAEINTEVTVSEIMYLGTDIAKVGLIREKEIRL